MAKRIPWIVFAQSLETYETSDEVIFSDKQEAEDFAWDLEEEIWSRTQEGAAEVYLEKITSEKVRRAFGEKAQRRMLQEFC